MTASAGRVDPRYTPFIATRCLLHRGSKPRAVEGAAAAMCFVLPGSPATGCSEPTQQTRLLELLSPIELSQKEQVFTLAMTLTRERSRAGRMREEASRATGALLVDYLDASGRPLLAANGTRIRGSCGATLIAPSYAITAAHCVDGATMDLESVVLELYRPTPALDQGFLRATTLTGTFPNFDHPRLGEADGYFVDRYSCALVSRCSEDFGGPVDCDVVSGSAVDTALIHCEGAPGLKYGFLDVASEDDLQAEVFLPWKHEVYDFAADTNDDRWEHYVAFTGDPSDNYHYFGREGAGQEANQLLPLVFVPFGDGTPHSKLSVASTVTTDLWGCHGTSGSGALQEATNGHWQLLGPMTAGNPELDAYLCDHVPSLDGYSREPGTLGLGYQLLSTTRQLTAAHQARLSADCGSFHENASSCRTHLECLRGYLASTPAGSLFTDSARPADAQELEADEDRVVRLSSGDVVSFSGFWLEAGHHYRVGLDVASSAGCSSMPCPEVSVGLSGRALTSVPLHAGSWQKVPVAAGFLAELTGTAALEVGVTGGGEFEIGALSLRLEGQPNSFDSLAERLEASLYDVDESASAAQPMRYVGDGKAGFAAWLLPHERMVLTRQGLVAGRRWVVRFSASSEQRLTCGFVDAAGQVKLAADCSGGRAELDDRQSTEGARAGFFIETAGDDAGTAMDDLIVVSDQAPDTDSDDIPDSVDDCPDGPVSPGTELAIDLPIASSWQVCLPGPTSVQVPVASITNACEPPAVRGLLSTVNGHDASAFGIEVSKADGSILLPLGIHEITWEVSDASGNVRATRKHAVTVVEVLDEACCQPVQSVMTGTSEPDGFAVDAGDGGCVLAGAGDDLIASSTGPSWLFGGDGSDFLSSARDGDLLVGGDGNDVLRSAGGGKLVAYGGSGDDTIHASSSASAFISGGPGADVIVGSDGPDEIFPGSGTLAVLCGEGDDRVTLYDVCEAVNGLQLVGGLGTDRLTAPAPRETLEQRGVSIDGFETFVVEADQAYLSDCYSGG